MSSRFAQRAAAILCLLAPAAALAQDSDAGPPPEPASAVAEALVGNSFFSQEELRERHSSVPGQNDALLRLTLDESASTRGDKLSFNAGLGLWWDLDGQPEGNPVNGFWDIHNEAGSPLWLDVYRLNLEYKPGNVLQLVRAGRQDAEHGRPATFDGADFELKLAPRVRFFAFGGRTVHFFEIDEKVFQNWIASAGFDVRLAENLKAEVEWRLLRDAVPSTDGIHVTSLLVTDNTYGASLQYRQGDWLKARAWIRGIRGALESTGFAARVESQEQLMGVDAKLDVQPATLNELNELDNPFYLTLGSSLPHLKGSLDAWKSYATAAGFFSVHVGGEIRQLLNGNAETLFNRNLLRGYLLASANELGGTHFYVSVNGDYTADGYASNNGALILGASAGWRTRALRFEAGTYYQRWEYVYYQQPEELANVRGYYGEAACTWRWLTVRGRYSREIFDRILQTFTFSLSEAF